MPNEMIRLPDGSLVMRRTPTANVDYYTGARFADLDPATGRLMASSPVMARQPSFGQFLKEKLAGLLPQRFEAKPAPWWIAQPQQAAPAAMPPVPQNIQQGRIDPFKEIEQETNKEEALAKELGDFSTRVMNSPQIIEGDWLGLKKK
jgi:hypothetical protein